MQTEPEIVFRNLDDAERARVEPVVDEGIERLDQLRPELTSCHVAVELPHGRHESGNAYVVRVEARYPGGEVVVRQGPSRRRAHEDDPVAIARDAFKKTYLRLEEKLDERRRHVKHHDEPPHGRITQLFPEQDHAFIRSSDGRDVYMHRNAVLDGRLEDLEIGQQVRYEEHLGEEGPQASSVRPVGRHHHLEG